MPVDNIFTNKRALISLKNIVIYEGLSLLQSFCSDYFSNKLTKW